MLALLTKPAVLATIAGGALLFLGGRSADQAGDAADQGADFLRSAAVLVAIAALAWLALRR